MGWGHCTPGLALVAKAPGNLTRLVHRTGPGCTLGCLCLQPGEPVEEAANSEQSVPPCDGTMPRSASELGRDSAGMQIAGPVKRGLWEPVSLLCSQPVPADASFPKK